MDREFMTDFYENYYEDPIYLATKNDKKYDKNNRKLVRLQDEVMQMVGGPKTPAGEKFKECMELTIKLSEYIGLDSYLQGAADREKMLR